MEYLFFHPEIMIVGIIVIVIIGIIIAIIYDRIASTYNGVYYGSEKRSKSEYELVSVEITRIKTVRITIKETFGKRTVSGYSQFKGVKFANLSPWETKIKTYIKSVPLSDCNLKTLKRRSDEDISFLAEQIAEAVQRKNGGAPILSADEEQKERNRVNALIYKFWVDADTIIENYAAEKDAESLIEFVQNVWNTRDNVEYANSLHFMTIKAIPLLYQLRESNPNAVDYTMMLCDMDLNNFDNLCKKIPMAAKLSLVSPQKKAIILEKQKRYVEALEFCEWCLARGIREERDKTFEARIERLKKKVNSI